MKKLLSVFVALVFVFAVSGVSLAAVNAAKGASPAKAAPAEKK